MGPIEMKQVSLESMISDLSNDTPFITVDRTERSYTHLHFENV